MDFDTILGYKVKKEKLLEIVDKYHLNKKSSYLLVVRNFIQKSGFPIDRFSSIRQEDKEKEDIDIQEILDRFPPIFFKLLKKDLDIEGEPEFYLAEP